MYYLLMLLQDPTPTAIVLTAEEQARASEFGFYLFLVVVGGALLLSCTMRDWGGHSAPYGRR